MDQLRKNLSDCREGVEQRAALNARGASILVALRNNPKKQWIVLLLVLAVVNWIQLRNVFALAASFFA